jgi:hypothetical protein
VKAREESGVSRRLLWGTWGLGKENEMEEIGEEVRK